MKRIIFSALIYAAMLTAAPAARAEIIGLASVIDGDTIEIHGQRIRLYGIDAPEGIQLCQLAVKKYQCGQKAAFALNDLIASKTVRCEEKSRDKYNRTVAICFAGAANINSWMVSQGWALAYRQYSQDFVKEENAARDSKAGLWAGEFQKPWDFRHGSSSEEAASSAPIYLGSKKS